MPFRAEQLARRIQDDLAEIIRRRVRDPRVGFVTIARVEVTDDLRVARIFVSELAATGQPAGHSVEALTNAAGFIRTELGRHLRLHHTPELRFIEDSSIAEGIRLTNLIDSLPEPTSGTSADEAGDEQAGGDSDESGDADDER